MAEQQQQHDHHKELQLLPSPLSTESPVRTLLPTVTTTDHHHSSSMFHHDLDLKLSISLSTIPTATLMTYPKIMDNMISTKKTIV
ncbi:hypothetical protein F2Q69_00061341 [Brassica cretica]|uniref:Uncharacterized protein n=1 Tax=Brassica cretica TaxID=69181 RepID=A0A8S9RN57_BRACR|nr:hypothetical protein F2Q69_00061341 [Brassica cretica]